MSMLPEAKLDILLAHHASLEAQLLGQVNSENYVRITRELAELNPLIDSVKAYRAANTELAGIDALIADPATEPEMRGMAEAERETLSARSDELAQQILVRPSPKDDSDRGGDGWRGAGSRGGRCRHQKRRFVDRGHALARRRRPACQQDRIRDPHHPYSDRQRRQHAGQPIPAQEPRVGDEHPALANLRRRAPAHRCRALGGPPREGRLPRSLRAHSYL